MWNRWKQKDSEFRTWTVPSFALSRYWLFLSIELLKKIRPCNLLLDVGCGKGSFLNLLNKSRKSAIMIGVEPILTHLKLIKRKNIHKIRAVGENLPLKDSIVDVVIVKATLDHVRDPQQVLTEISRVATKQSQLHILQGLVENSSHTHVATFSARKLNILLKVTGWKIVRQKTFYSMRRFQRVLMLIPRFYAFLSRFFGVPTIQLINATKSSGTIGPKLEKIRK